METDTIKLCFEIRGIYQCPRCEALYYHKVKCRCPNLELAALGEKNE